MTDHKKKQQLSFDDHTIKKNFESFRQKIQTLFSQNPRSRHVVFTPANLRMMYILYLSKIHESSLYKNHQCHLCIIYDREDIITMDINTRYPSNDIVKSFMKHAEVNALLNLRKINTTPNGSHGLFITRFSKTSILNYSNPCFFCARFIKKNLAYFHSISFTDSNEQLIVMTPDEFKNTDFHHKSQRYKNLVFPKEKKDMQN